MKNFSFSITPILVIAFVFLATSCEKENTPDVTGSWKVIYFEDLNTSTITTKEDLDTPENLLNKDVIITFKENDMTDSGEFSGETLSNTFSGDYVIETNESINFPSFQSTLVSETPWGDLFFEAILASETFKIENTELLIYYDDGQKSMVLERN